MMTTQSRPYTDADQTVIGHWKIGEHQHMRAEAALGHYSVWLLAAPSQQKWLVAEPYVTGCAVHDMRFAPPFAGGRHYSEFWRQVVRAKFITAVAVAYPALRREAEEHQRMNTLVTTLGTFDFEGTTWTVESHLGNEIRAVRDGQHMATMRVDAHGNLAEAVPSGTLTSGSVEWLDRIHDFTVAVLTGAARDDRGPWANQLTK